ncbi:MAG: hypothetical protein MUO62_11675 [Anaerolineales bacterium]|nr:hypothetical protein [Anaerolineales bacterium]
MILQPYRCAGKGHDHVVSSGRVPAFNLLALLHIAHGHLGEVSLAVEQGLENFNLQGMAFSWWWETLPILMSETELARGELETERGVDSAGRGAANK